jgi:prepilin-type N-terminal cleavage/methylation domain-containing protein
MLAGLRPHAVARRTLGRGREAGFTLAEVVVSIAVIGIVMSALTTFFVKSTAVTNQQRAKQVAVQLAADGSERVRAIKGDKLADGRAQCNSSTKPCANPDAGLTLPLTRRWDASGTGPRPLPIEDSPQVNGVSYRRSWYLVKCWQSANNGDCVNDSNRDVEFFRVIVAVTWDDSHCKGGRCSYTTATLVSTAAGEPLYPGTP